MSLAASGDQKGGLRDGRAHLPADHRALLEEVGASQWTVVGRLLGEPVHKLLRSAGGNGLSEHARHRTDEAVAVWIPDLRIVVFNSSHPILAGLEEQPFERIVARTAWHEWGHALSIARCTKEDVDSGTRLLDLAPTSVSKVIRAAGYRPHEYTHELVADVYAMLIERRRHEEPGRPPWLHREIYDLVKRVTAWTE
jgi:hypothetical protein